MRHLILSLVAICTGFITSPAIAEEIQWVWANNPSLSTEYTAPASYSYNDNLQWIATGAGSGYYSPLPNTIHRQSTGVYRVYLPMPPSETQGGNVQVAAYGNDSAYCKVASWTVADRTGAGHSTHHVADVRCYNAAGAPIDSRFTLQFLAAPIARGGVAYLWANDATSASYTPILAYQYNSRGGTNTVTRSGAGQYTVSLPGFTGARGNPQVTAYGSGTERCKITSWSAGSSGTSVGVACHNTAGAAVDTRFSFSYLWDQGASFAEGSYVWTGGASAGTITPSPVYAYYDWNTAGSGSRTRHSAGSYTVRINGAGTPSLGYSTTEGSTDPIERSLVLVSAYGSDASHCKVVSWSSPDNVALDIRINCFNSSGAAADSMFALRLHSADPAQREVVASEDSSYDYDSSSRSSAFRAWWNFLDLLVRIAGAYEDFLASAGLTGLYDGTIYGPNASHVAAFLSLQQADGKVTGRLLILDDTLSLEDPICPDQTIPVSALPVHATVTSALHASGSTVREVELPAFFHGEVETSFSLVLESTNYQHLTGTIVLSPSWPCADQTLTFSFQRRNDQLFPGVPATVPAPPQCSSGRTACGQMCFDLETDESNCGACGNACSQYETCLSGYCENTDL